MSSIAVARSVIAAALAVVVSAAFGGCGTAAVEGGPLCTYGQVVACLTDAGCQGTRMCLPDTSGYGPCTCDGSDGGVPRAEASAGGAPSDGGP